MKQRTNEDYSESNARFLFWAGAVFVLWVAAMGAMAVAIYTVVTR